jgi:hypothetical protein
MQTSDCFRSLTRPLEKKMTADRNNSPEHFVRLIAQLQVKPTQFPVVAAHDKMIAGWVNVHAGYPLDPRHECLE